MGGARRILARRMPEIFGYRAELVGRLADRFARSAEVREEHVQLARELVRLEPDLDEPRAEVLLLAVIALLEAVEQGSTRLPLDAASLDLEARPWWGPEHLEALDTLIRDGGAPTLIGSRHEVRPLIVDDDHLYMHRMFVQEVRLATALAGLSPSASHFVLGTSPCLGEDVCGAALNQPPPQTAGDVREADRGGALQLSDEQRLALELASTASLAVISGGPGTGKTSIVISLLRRVLQQGLEPDAIALCAPTGKAARRLADSIQGQLAGMVDLLPLERQLLRRVAAPRTVHRLLGYTSGEQRFKHDAHRPLQHELVIVDEASMVDLELMEHLLRALGANTRLVLLGDANQLPSVEAGAVLRDLVADDEHHPMARASVRLTRSFRMDPTDPDGRRILLAANQIVAGDVGWLGITEPDTDDETRERQVLRREAATGVRYGGVELLPGTSAVLAAMLERWFEERTCGMPGFFDATARVHRFVAGQFDPEDEARIRALIDHVEAFRVLCLTRSGPRGTRAVNARLHTQLLDRMGIDTTPAFVPGEPVMMLRNDYDKQLFNGDTGIVLRVVLEHDTRDQRSIMAVFPRASGELGVYHLDSLRGELELAHAITVHKSQGSEYRDALFVLPDQDGPLLTREMLYTAVTRSRRSVLIAGDEALLAEATRRRVVRHSGIAERLARLAPSA